MDQVEPGDAAVDDTVLDVLGDVGSTDKQDVDGSAAAMDGKYLSARLLGSETGILEQCPRGFAEPPLGGDGDGQVVDGRALRLWRAAA